MTFYTLQLFRFIAAVMVMCHHLAITRSGNRGVDIFFVISGFVIYLKLFSPHRSSGFRFFTNRFTKIFFLYWLAFVAMFFVIPFPQHESIIGVLLLVPGHFPWLRVSWSLSYELYFYFLTGAVAYLLRDRMAKGFLFTILLISTIITTFSLSNQIHIKGTLLNFLLGKNPWNFLLGLLCGYLSSTVFAFARVSIIIPACLLGYVLFSACFIFPSENIFPVLLTETVAVCLVCSSVGYEKRKALPAKAVSIFGVLGDASYAIYLFAPVVGNIIPGRSNWDKTLIVILTIVVSVLINQFIENRGLLWCRKMIYKLNPAG